MWKLIRTYGLKIVKTGLKYRIYVYVAVIVAAMAYVTNYVVAHNKMEIKLQHQKNEITRLTDRNIDLEAIINERNARIIKINQELIKKAAEAQRKINQANAAAFEAQIQRDEIAEELAVIQFQTLEAMRDDEEFSDWSIEPVPAIGWWLLRKADQGNTD